MAGLLAAVAAVAGPATGTVAAQGAVEPPRWHAAEHGHPDYPAEADGAPARVLLSISVDAYGRVVGADVLEVDRNPPADAVFREAAVAWVSGIELEPARRDGEPVPATLRFEVLFEPPPEGSHAHRHEHPHAHPGDGPGGPVTEHAHPHPHQHAHEGAPDDGPAADGAAVAADAGGFSATATTRLGVVDEVPRAASDLEVEIGLLRALPRRTAEELLTLAPGIVLTNHSGIGHASAYYLRGFDAAEGQDVEVLVEGMPINEPSNAHVHGYADAAFVIPEAVRAVRVLEGPFDPRQGDFAVAGTFEYRLGMPERGVRAHAEYGSFDTKRALLSWAPEGQSEGTFVAVDLRDGDGFGPNRAHQSVAALGRYEGGVDAPLRWALTLGSSALEYDSAGIIREDDFRARELDRCASDRDAQFFCLYDPNQGGSASRHFAQGELTWRGPGATFEQRLFVTLRRQRIRENFTGWLLDPQGDGLDALTETTTFGLRGALRLAPTWFKRRQLVELGYAARHDTGSTRMWRIRTEGGDPYRTVFDTELGLTNVGVYGTAEVRPVDWLAVRAGLRVDTFAYSLVDRDRPTSDRTGERLPTEAVDAFGVAVLPKGTVRLRLVPGLEWVTSVGLGARSSDAVALSEGERAPFAEVRSAETGLALDRPALGPVALEARAFGFFSRVTQDLVFDAERGRNVDAGPSNRFGASAFLRLRAVEAVDVVGSFTWTEAHFNEDGFVALGRGQRVPFVPRFVASLASAGQGTVALSDAETLAFRGGGSISWVGPRPLPLGAESEPIVTVDLQGSVRWRFLEAGLMVLNLLDRRNRAAEFEHPSNFEGPDAPPTLRAARHFAAGAPRTVLGTLTLWFDTRGFAGEAKGAAGTEVAP